MMDASEVRSQLREAIVQAALTVASQVQGQSWAAAESAPDKSTCTTLGIRLEGSTAATFKFTMANESVLRVVELFLGTVPEVSAEQPLSEEHLEVLHEFIRQVMGLAVSQLRPTFGQLSPSIVKTEDESDSGEPIRSTIAAGDSTISFELRVPPNDADALAAAAQSLSQATPAPDASEVESKSRVAPPPSEQSSSAIESEVAPDSQIAKYLQERNFNLLLDIELQVSLRFGRREMLLKDILELSSGSVVELDRMIQEPVDLLLDHKVIARGEVVIVEGNYGVRVTEVATAQQRIECLC